MPYGKFAFAMFLFALAAVCAVLAIVAGWGPAVLLAGLLATWGGLLWIEDPDVRSQRREMRDLRRALARRRWL